MCIDTCMDMYIDKCIDMCVDMYIDMCINMVGRIRQVWFDEQFVPPAFCLCKTMNRIKARGVASHRTHGPTHAPTQDRTQAHDVRCTQAPKRRACPT